MPSYNKSLRSGSPQTKDDRPKDLRDLWANNKMNSSSLSTNNDQNYRNTRGMKTKLKMYPKNISKVPSVQRIEEEPASNRSSGSSRSTVSIYFYAI